MVHDIQAESMIDNTAADLLDLVDREREPEGLSRDNHDLWKHAGEKGLAMPRPTAEQAIPSLQAVAAYLKGRFRHLENELSAKSASDPIITSWQKSYPLTKDYERLLKPHREAVISALGQQLKEKAVEISHHLELVKAKCSKRSIDMAAAGQSCYAPARSAFGPSEAVSRLKLDQQGERNVFKSLFDELVLPLAGEGSPLALENHSAQRAYERFGQNDADVVSQFEALVGDATRNAEALARLVQDPKLRQSYEQIVKDLLLESSEFKPLTSEGESANAVSNTQLSSEAAFRWEYLYLGNVTHQFKELAQKYHRATEPGDKARRLHAFQLHGASVTRRIANLQRSLELSVKALTNEKLLQGLDPLNQALVLAIAEQKSRVFEWALNPSSNALVLQDLAIYCAEHPTEALHSLSFAE
jgi:hypothetical protein